MPLPVVAIVGRPNVGKSSLFNWLAGRRISIVDPTAGVTRDRVATVIPVGERYCELVDTGGMGIQDVDDLTEDVERQIRHAIDEASVVLFLVDLRDGLVTLDELVAERLRDLGKPVVFVGNKADTEKLVFNSGDFYRFGYGAPIPVSAHQLVGRDELYHAIREVLPPDGGDERPPGEVDLKVAIVGRRNVGKSTFINSLAETDRVIVSEVAGTTRDSIDVRFERDGKAFLAIDTAGVRKKQKLATGVEFYSMARAERSIRRADVVFHLFDPQHRVSRVDKQLAQYVVEQNKPCVFVVNKWDIMKEKFPSERMGTYLRTMFPMLDHVPIAFITATKGKNVLRLLQLARQLHKQAGHRVGTGDLNRVLRQALVEMTPPMRGNRTPKMFFATQVGVRPPTIVLMTNGPELFDDTYVRYLTKVFRDSFPFGEVSLKVVLRAKGEGRGTNKPSAVEHVEEAAPVPIADAADEWELVPDAALIPDGADDPDEPLELAELVNEAPPPPPKPPIPRPKRIAPGGAGGGATGSPPAAKPRPPAKKKDSKTWDF